LCSTSTTWRDGKVADARGVLDARKAHAERPQQQRRRRVQHAAQAVAQVVEAQRHARG
jgi:hypothetical protein